MTDIMDNEDIYSQKDLDEEREAVVDRVLEIIDGERVRLREPKSTKEEYDAYNKGRDEMRTVIYKKVLALKGGEQE